ncbi:hypothetical protein K1T71_014594 [Dendrolimus kikuchii]|uniref:Uncharacterized protein n=1 Tax=Dendrolimus kikuchii TaxID=765133 RepID=A0ACC1CEK2_9NEOP|nr:hypothetical protein K1T71_014594 [Dendrolimus kikuchii]
MQDISRDKIDEIITSQVHIKQENQCKKCQRIIHEIFDTDLPHKEAVERVEEVPIKDKIVHITTAKENEEKLMQKLETIEETPLVEAAKPKVEGFNLTPKVLGNTIGTNSSEHCQDTNIAYHKYCDQKNLVDENSNLNYPSYKPNYFEQAQNSGKRPDVEEEIKNKPTEIFDKKELVSRTNVEPICIVPNSYGQNSNHDQYYYQQQHHSFPYSQDNVYNQENSYIVNKDLKSEKSFKDDGYNFVEDSAKNRKTGSTEADVQISIDEMAKRCLNSPSNEIDERLLKEMEKLAVPQTETKASGTPMLNDVIQMDLHKKTKKQVEKHEIDLETRMTDKNIIDVKNDCVEKLNPPYEANHLEKEIIKQDIETLELKYEKLIHNFNNNLLNIEEESNNKEQLPIITINSINATQTDNITNYESKLVANSIITKSENTSNELKETSSKDAISHTTASYAQNITDLYNKQIGESTDIRANTTEKSQKGLSRQRTSNINAMQSENIIDFQSKQAAESTHIEVNNINEKSENMFHVNANSYIKAIQAANTAHLENKLGHDLNYIKSKNTAEKTTHPIVNGNEFLLDTTKTHYEKIMQILATRQSLHPNQVHIDPYDKNTLSQDVDEYDHKTLAEMNVSEHKYKHTEEADKPRLSNCDEDEKHARLCLATKETSPISAREVSPPVIAVETSRLKPCRDIDVNKVDLPQMIYIDNKSDPTQHTCDVQDTNVCEPIENQIAITPVLKSNDTKENIIKESGILQVQRLCEPKPSVINTANTPECELVNTTNIHRTPTKSVRKPLGNYTATIQISPETYTNRAASAENELKDDKQDNLNPNPNDHYYRSYYDSNNQINDNPKQPDTIEIDFKKEEHPKSTEQISHSFLQPEGMINPLSEKIETGHGLKGNLSSLGPLPKLKDEELTLSQLLRRIRARNKMQECKEFEGHTLSSQTKVDTLEGKCGDKKPICPPPAPECPPKNPCPPPPCPPPPPPCPPPPPPCPKPCKPECPPKNPCPPPPCPPPPPPCPPPPPPCPEPCKPKCPQPCPPPKKNPCDKYIKKCYGTLKDMIQILLLGQKLPSVTEKRYLSADIVAKLHSLFLVLKILQLEGRLKTAEIDSYTNSGQICTSVIMARDFKPWTPIPSWPIPKKEKKRPLVCPKEGCKAFPAVTPNLNLPYRPKHCPGFPKRTFSIPDLLFTENKRKLFDLGYF